MFALYQANECSPRSRARGGLGSCIWLFYFFPCNVLFLYKSDKSRTGKESDWDASTEGPSQLGFLPERHREGKARGCRLPFPSAAGKNGEKKGGKNLPDRAASPRTHSHIRATSRRKIRPFFPLSQVPLDFFFLLARAQIQVLFNSLLHALTFHMR